MKNIFYIVVGIVIIVCVGIPNLLVAGKLDHEPGDGKPTGRTVVPKNQESNDEICKINPGDISRFANGDGYNFGSVVQLVANPGCARVSSNIVAQEIAQGVKFNRTPFHLDDFSKGYSNLTNDGKRSVEAGIQKNVAATLRNTPMSNRELLPVLGQLSLLSPKAARSMLAYLITQELISQEVENKTGSLEGRESTLSVDTISALKKFGADEPLIMKELSASVEEMATTSQADSLGKVLAGLALAAREFDEFSQTFNMSAGAFKKGVGLARDEYSDSERGSLLKAGFSAASASVGFSPAIEMGARDINDALAMLLRGQPLAKTTLKDLWRKVLDVASASPEQTALAQALALSFTSEVIFLPKKDRDKVLECAKNHSAVASVIQDVFLEAWKESRQQLSQRKLKVAQFNERKEKFFDPWVSGILDFDVTSVNANWLKEVVSKGMVKDEEIQTKFPRFVLTLLNIQENSTKRMAIEGGLESMMETSMNSFGVLWSLSNVYIPTLNDWAKRHDEE